MTNRQPIVVIDPGHGGSANVGGSSANNATGPNGLLEKDLTLDLARRVAAALASDAQVICTRQDDRNLSLAARAEVARQNQAAIFLSIHLNGFRDPQVDGTEVWVARNASADSRALAAAVLSRLVPVTNVRDRGVRERNLGVLLPSRHAPDTAACLAEIAFLTNPAQASRLEDLTYRQQIAEALAQAIRERLPQSVPTGVQQSYTVQRASFRPVHALNDVTLVYGIPDGAIMDPYYRNAAERPSGHARRDCHLGVDISRAGGGNRDENDPRRGTPVYAALLPSVDLSTLNTARPATRDATGNCGGVMPSSSLGIPGSGMAVLQDAVVDVQKWSSQSDGAYGGVIGLACHYRYSRDDGSADTFTLYLEYLHLITPSFLPRIPNSGGGYRTLSVDEWNATGRGLGFGPQIIQDAQISAQDLTSGSLLIGYLGATQTPHVHIQAAYGSGARRYIATPRFDPLGMLNSGLTITGQAQALNSIGHIDAEEARRANAELTPRERQQQTGWKAASALSGGAIWAEDSLSPDYRHLNAAGVSEAFTFNGAVLSALCQYNRFDVSGGQDQVLFGLRGCRIVDAPAGFAASVTLSEDVPDHGDFHCVLGVWRRSTDEIVVYRGSTVPNWDYMQQQVNQGGQTSNMLGTGCHLVTVGQHRNLPGAFRQAEDAVVLRSNDDLSYTVLDTWDSGMFGDNIHPAYLDRGANPPFFSSAGCQTIPGGFSHGQHTGDWAAFRQAAGLSPNSPASENGLRYVYVLLTGREARLAAAGASAADLTRLRFGSRGVDVEALQLGLQNAGALSGAVDGVMSAGTTMDYIRWQQAHDNGRADGVVTPQTANALGFDMLTGQSIQPVTQSQGALNRLGRILSEDIPLDPGTGGRSIGQDALEIGDIIVSTTPATVSRAIRFATGSHVSHAMLYIGAGQVVEAVGEGVRLSQLQDSLAGASLAVAFRYPDLTEQQALQIRDYAGMQMGKPYNYIGIVRHARFRLDRTACYLLDPVGAGTSCRDWLGRIYLGPGNNDSFFCSQLIVDAYAQAGVPITDRPATWSTPEDLVELQLRDRLGYVGHLVALPASSQATSTSLYRAPVRANHGRNNGSWHSYETAAAALQVPTAVAEAPDSFLNYNVAGTVPALQQPSGNTCWATVAAMVTSWKYNQSHTLEQTVSRMGPSYLQAFRSNQTLAWSDHLAFAQALGLTPEPLMNYSVQGIQSLLQSHGPLIAISATPSGSWATHALVITGLYGSGGADDTYLQVNDPATGTSYPIRYDVFMRRYEAASDRPGLGVQMMHY